MAVVNGYCTREQLIEWNKATASANASMLEQAINACSRGIDRFCERTFFQVTEARYFDVSAGGDVVPFGPYNDLVSLTAVAVDDTLDGTWATAWSATDYQLLPLNPNAGPEQRPYTSLRASGTRSFPSICTGRVGLIRVTGTWGWPSVPPDITQACIMHAARIFNRKESPHGVAGWGEFGAIRVGRTDPDVVAFLDPYQYFGGIGFA